MVPLSIQCGRPISVVSASPWKRLPHCNHRSSRANHEQLLPIGGGVFNTHCRGRLQSTTRMTAGTLPPLGTLTNTSLHPITEQHWTMNSLPCTSQLTYILLHSLNKHPYGDFHCLCDLSLATSGGECGSIEGSHMTQVTKLRVWCATSSSGRWISMPQSKSRPMR